MHNIQTISKFGITCHSKLLQKVILTFSKMYTINNKNWYISKNQVHTAIYTA